MDYKETFYILFFSFFLLPPLASCSTDFYSMEDYPNVEKIDAHVHINVEKSALVEQAIRDNFRLVNVNVDGLYPDLTIYSQGEVAKSLLKSYPEHVAWISTFEMGGWDDIEVWKSKTLKYLEESFKAGAIGVKFWKNIGMEFRDESGDFIMVDHPGFDPIIEFIKQQNKMVLGHIGEPREAWLPLEQMQMHRGYFENNPQYHMYLHPEYPSYEKIIDSRNRLLEKHSDLTFMGAHLGSMEWSIEMMSEHLDRYPAMAIGTAARMRHIYRAAGEDPKKARDFFIRYQDQLIYSTDLSENPWSDFAQTGTGASGVWEKDWEFFVTDHLMTDSGVEESFRGLKLPREIVDKIYRENAKNWVNGL